MDSGVSQRSDSRDNSGLFILTFVIGMFALIAAVVVIIISFGDDDGASAAESVETATEFDVELHEFTVTPATIDVPVGVMVTLHVTNKGTLAHDLTVDGGATPLLVPGKFATSRWARSLRCRGDGAPSPVTAPSAC